MTTALLPEVIIIPPLLIAIFILPRAIRDNPALLPPLLLPITTTEVPAAAALIPDRPTAAAAPIPDHPAAAVPTQGRPATAVLIHHPEVLLHRAALPQVALLQEVFLLQVQEAIPHREAIPHPHQAALQAEVTEVTNFIKNI